MIKWFKHFFWFMNESRYFLNCNIFQVIHRGGIKKAIWHANYMLKLEEEYYE